MKMMDAEDMAEAKAGIAPSPGEERSELAKMRATNIRHTEASKALGHHRVKHISQPDTPHGSPKNPGLKSQNHGTKHISTTD